MKNIVIFDDYKERDLKPPALLTRYLELTERDVAATLVPAATVEVPCPACGSPEVVSSFEKFALTYRECGNCGSLYVSPRPDDAALAAYDAQSEARCFWREELAPGSGAARREKIVKPRSAWVVDTVREYLPNATHLADVGTAQYDYITEIASEGLFARITLVDPVVEVPAGEAGIETGGWDELEGGCIDAVTLLEVADRAADVEGLLALANEAMCPGGLVFMTAVLSSGFDVQVLWDRAANVFPPDRLNVLTVDGVKALAERTGFELIELSTPGILDLDIVTAAAERDPSIELPRWARYLGTRPEHTRRDFQSFLQTELLSSYGRFVLRKI